MNIYPEDLEVALRAQPQVKDCAVIALPREGNAEPCAVLILRDREEAAAVVRRANESLAEYQRMHVWFVWPEDDFPRTSTQKPRTSVIREVVQEELGQRFGQSRGDRRASPLVELILRVTGRAPARLPGEETRNVRLDEDLGLSSLDRVELLSSLEDHYQIDLSETSFAAVNTVGDLERMLHRQPPPRTVYHYPRWVQRWPVTWLRLVTDCLLLLPAVYVLGWPRVDGRENLLGVRGPALVVCNHIADVDGGFVKVALPARLRHKLVIATGGEALEVLRTPPAGRNPFLRVYDRVKWVLGVSLLNLFPLPREAGFRESFAFAGETVDRGYSVLLFPEGRHTEDGKMRPFRAGIGLLANNLRIPVVPMRIDGLFELKRAGKRFARPHAIRIKIGPPIRFEPERDPQWIAGELQKRVEAM
jgi:long-chain acyl-CoA synthetase